MLSDQGMDGLNGGLWIHPSWRGSTAAWFLQSPVTGDDPQEIRRIQWFRISNHSWDTDSLTSGYVIHIFKKKKYIYIYTVHTFKNRDHANLIKNPCMNLREHLRTESLRGWSMVGHYGPYCQNLLQGSALEGKGQTGAFQKPESSKAASTKNCSLEKTCKFCQYYTTQDILGAYMAYKCWNDFTFNCVNMLLKGIMYSWLRPNFNAAKNLPSLYHRPRSSQALWGQCHEGLGWGGQTCNHPTCGEGMV